MYITVYAALYKVCTISEPWKLLQKIESVYLFTFIPYICDKVSMVVRSSWHQQHCMMD